MTNLRSCTGKSSFCPPNELSANYTVCNYAQNACTPPARCNGTEIDCPTITEHVCNGTND